MSLTSVLDSDLLTAQDSQTRHPLIKIVSNETSASIPFDGVCLTSETVNEQHPDSILHSEGRIVEIHRKAALGGDVIVLSVTDIDRTQFSLYSISVSSGRTIQHLSLVEISTTQVGIVSLEYSGGVYYLRRYIVDLYGNVVSQADVASWASIVTSPSVVKLTDNSYFLVYIKYAGSHYHFFKKTSSDFTTWTAETEMVVGGLTPTNEITSVFSLMYGTDILIWFDYVESVGSNSEKLSNIYYSESSDGSSWSNAEKETYYDTYSAIATNPMALIRHDGSMDVVFNEICGALLMDTSTSLWRDGSRIQDMHFDSVNRKLYCVTTDGYTGSGGHLGCVVKIDVDSWSVDKAWDTSTAPSFNPTFWNSGDCYIYEGRCHGEGSIQPVVSSYPALGAIGVLDGEADIITEYVFANDSVRNMVKNVQWTPITYWYYSEDPGGSIAGPEIRGVWYDEVSTRLYVCIIAAGSGFVTTHIGYIDRSEPGTIDSFGVVQYTFHDVVTDLNRFVQTNLYANSQGSFWVSTADDILIYSSGGGVAYGFHGTMVIYSLSTGAFWKSFNVDTHPGYPHEGIKTFVYQNGIVYGDFAYEGSVNPTARGLCMVNLSSELITYDRPSWASVDDYGLRGLCLMGTTKLGVSSEIYGVSIYDLLTNTWTLYDDSNVWGIVPVNNYPWFSILCYDELNQMIMAGSESRGMGNWVGLVMFSEYGSLKQSHRITGLHGGAWIFNSPSPLTIEYQDYDAVITEDPDDYGLYAFWVRKDILEDSIKWDKEIASFNLRSYLLKGSEILAEKTIDKPSTLSFSVKDGHLFDSHNSFSLLSIYLKKGRRLSLSYGELINSEEIWQAWGVFVVTRTSISYEKPNYPVMHIECEDRRTHWNHEITVSPYYSNRVGEILLDLLDDNTDFDASDIIIPTITNDPTLYIQWIEKQVSDIVNQVLNRVGYYVRLTVDDDVSARKISDSNAVDHVYSDNTKIVNFTPDDENSENINQVIVTGTERDFIEVLYTEERVGELSGSHRWNTGTEDYTILYSTDGSRRCRSPRLVVKETATSIAFELAGGVSESISFIDPNEKYCIITVDSPDLTWEFVAALAALALECLIFDQVSTAAIPVVTDPVSGEGFTVPDPAAGVTIPWGRVTETATLIIALQILASTGNFQYEVWANPVGYVRRSVQSVANDLQAQVDAGMIVTKKLDDPLCYSSQDCAVVAQFELNVAKWQRSRVSFKKVADLRDEDGDTISILHPYTEQTMKIFIANLKRSFLVPTEGSTEQKDNGGFIDNIEGWKI
jgi:hypothetical protein